MIPRILITIEGGCVQNVTADGHVDVRVLDLDPGAVGEPVSPQNCAVDVLPRDAMSALLATPQVNPNAV